MIKDKLYLASQKKEFWVGFEFCCQLVEDMGYVKSSNHPYNIADCLRRKCNQPLPNNRKRIRKNIK